jgi:hypothetical protein
MSSITDLALRVNSLIELGNKTMSTVESVTDFMTTSWVNSELFYEFRTSSLSYILNVYGASHPYYKNFDESVKNADPLSTEKGRGILKSIKNEVDSGWLFTLKGIVSAEIFSDFLEMSSYLLTEGYKDPAAVMIGSVLEEHLRQLALRNRISTEELKNGKLVSKKADLLNSEISNAGVYNKLDQKNVTAWLDLRNKAAHGKYSEYNSQQVETLLFAVREFISRNHL